VTPIDQDLADRRPVWVALSTLFLDTDLTPDRLEEVAAVLAASPYSLEELRRIFFEEVRPVLERNLSTPAGVWDAFDEAWLEREIVRHRKSLLLRLFRAWSPRGFAWAEEWADLRRRVERRRA